jgi:hypothetical protein
VTQCHNSPPIRDVEKFIWSRSEPERRPAVILSVDALNRHALLG